MGRCYRCSSAAAPRAVVRAAICATPIRSSLSRDKRFLRGYFLRLNRLRHFLRNPPGRHMIGYGGLVLLVWRRNPRLRF